MGENSLNGTPQVVIYGASGHSFAIAQVFTYSFAPIRVCDVVAFIDDYRGGQGLELHGTPIVSFSHWRERLLAFPCFVAVADPSARRQLAEKVLAAGGRFEGLYNRAELSMAHVTIGVGTIVATPTYIGPNSRIGNHVQIMPMCSIGHDVLIGDFVTVCPSCTVSGYVIIEAGVFIGAGSTIVNGTLNRPLVVGRGARVSAGAVVTKPIPSWTTVAGNPARPLRELAQRLVIGE
jgi:sugar O-acyltransferase (sialic acid O-acetyltransferase NeuD family)